MRNPNALSPWVYFPLHRRRTDRNCPSQLLLRHRPARHLLCSCSLPLCPLNRSCIRHYRSFRTLIPTFLRIHPSQHMNKNPLWGHVRRCQPYFLPPTFPWACWNASPILRLPRRLRTMKHSLIYWFTNLTCCCHYIPIYSLRSLCR